MIVVCETALRRDQVNYRYVLSIPTKVQSWGDNSLRRRHGGVLRMSTVYMQQTILKWFM